MTLDLAIPDDPQALPPRTLVELPLDQIAPDLRQPRKRFDPEALRRLADDIHARGVLQPITVAPTAQGRYLICYGERRYRAAQMAGLQTIPCLIERAIDDDTGVTRAFDQLAENLHREDLDPLELGAFFRRLRDEHDIPVGEIPALCERNGLSISRSYVSNLIRLTELPDWAQDLIHAGKLSASHGKTLLLARNHPEVLEHLRERLTGDHVDYQNDPPTVRDLQADIYSACQRTYRIVTHGGHPLIEQHRDQLQILAVTVPWGPDRQTEFARNGDLLEQLYEQIDAERKSRNAETAPAPADENDDADGPGGDQQAEIPADQLWPRSTEWRRRRALLDSLGQALATAIVGELTDLHLDALVLWLAHGGPEAPIDDPRNIDSTTYELGCGDLMQACATRTAAEFLDAIEDRAHLQRLTREHLPGLLADLEPGALIRLADDLSIGLDTWRPTREYLDTLTSEEFHQLLQDSDLADHPELAEQEMTRPRLLNWALDHAADINPPRELLDLWNESTGDGGND